MYIYNNFLICALSSFFTVFIFYMFFNTFGSARFSHKRTYLFLVGIGILFTFCFYFTSPGVLRVILLFACNILCSLLVKLKWHNYITLNLFGYASTSIAEFIVAGFLSFIFNVDMIIAKENTFIYLTGLILSKIVHLIVFSIIRVQKHKLIANKSKKHLFTLLLFPLASILIIILQYSFFLEIKADNQGLLFFTIVVYSFLIFSNIYVFYYIDHMQENIDKSAALDSANKIIEQQSAQYSELLSYQEGVMKIQHDHKNFIMGIIHDLEKGNVDKANARLLEEYSFLAKKNLSFGGNIVQSIIDIKSKDLENIKITLEYKDLHKIKISYSDVAVLVGNALDNAIEAVKKIKTDKEKVIEVFAQVRNDTIVIIVKNPTADKVDVNKLVTTKPNKLSHGYGILSIKNLAKKYDGDVVFEWENYRFTASILINNINNEE